MTKNNTTKFSETWCGKSENSDVDKVGRHCGFLNERKYCLKEVRVEKERWTSLDLEQSVMQFVNERRSMSSNSRTSNLITFGGENTMEVRTGQFRCQYNVFFFTKASLSRLKCNVKSTWMRTGSKQR